MALGFDLQDGETVLLIEKCHALDQAGDALGLGWWSWGLQRAESANETAHWQARGKRNGTGSSTVR